MSCTVYILRTSGNTLYIGQTNNLEKRLKEHKGKNSKSAKYTRGFHSVKLVYKEEYKTRREALQREAQLKKWPKAKKETFIRHTFQERVYAIASKIPLGKVATYGQIAKLAGNPKAARVVGFFMKTNPFAPRVPCHRVVASDGELTGFSALGGITEKKKMLLHEGVVFNKNTVNLLKCLWDGKA